MVARRPVTRGEIWQANLDPVRGHEHAGVRPVIVVSASDFNLNRGGLIVVVPVSRTDRGNPLHVEIRPAKGDLRHRSFALCDMVRSVSSERLEYFVGSVDRNTLDDVADRLRIILDL